MHFAEYESYDGLGLAELVANDDVKPEELLDAAIERADARNPVLPLIGGMEPYGNHDWINLFKIWDLWSYDTAIAKTTWTLGWLGIVATVFWYTWRWIASPSGGADGDDDIFPHR